MAYYVTPDDVQAIMKKCPLTDDQIDPYIKTAHIYILRVFDGLNASEELLTDIERWFTAHLIASIHDKTTTKEKIGDAEVNYAVKVGEGLKSTPYGEMVLALDTSGLLAKAGKMKAMIYAVPAREEDV